MRRCLLVLALVGCAEARPAPAEPPPAPAPAQAGPTTLHKLTTENFDVEWDEPTSTEAEAKAVADRAEKARAKYVELLGDGRVGDAHMYIRLAGEGKGRKYPSVEAETRDIRLYRYPGPGGEYEASAAHELVHAIRWARWRKPERQTDVGLFYEEAFAEMLAREAGFPSTGFPLYGVDPNVAAASFLDRGEALPIQRIVTEHRDVNFRCMAQTYVGRVAFMAHVRRRVGFEKLVTLADLDAPLNLQIFEEHVGAKLPDLIASFEKEVRATAQRPEARDAGKAYREKTPIRLFPICSR
jgi:hypothetical protein